MVSKCCGLKLKEVHIIIYVVSSSYLCIYYGISSHLISLLHMIYQSNKNRHYDNPGPPNNRILTCVIYLNPNWENGDGGEIVLCPFLTQSKVIPPLHRRAVFFYSDCILHRVLPSKSRRVCFTIWCNGMNVNSKDDVMLSKEHLQFTSYDDAERFFARSPLQRVISRAVYDEEYLQSLHECITSQNDKNSNASISNEDREKVTQQHHSSVLGIMKKLRPLIEEFRRRKSALVAK